MPTFYETLTAAVADITEHGFDNAERIERWMTAIRIAAEASLPRDGDMEKKLKSGLRAIYKRMVDDGQIVKRNPGLSRYTINQVAPKLRAELERRIMASANLIKLNRDASIQKTMQRFSGWATSVPAGGGVVDKAETKGDIRKSLAQLPFEVRRVLIDQGHKLVSSLSDIVATDGGAIAAEWRSNWKQVGYDYRVDHKYRDGKTYAVRGNWALEKGLMKPGEAGFVDEIDRPAELPFCRCYYRFLFNLRDLPEDMLTAKGKSALKESPRCGLKIIEWTESDLTRYLSILWEAVSEL